MFATGLLGELPPEHVELEGALGGDGEADSAFARARSDADPAAGKGEPVQAHGGDARCALVESGRGRFGLWSWSAGEELRGRRERVGTARFGPLLVLSRRIADTARRRGGASDGGLGTKGLVAALVRSGIRVGRLGGSKGSSRSRRAFSRTKRCGR